MQQREGPSNGEADHFKPDQVGDAEGMRGDPSVPVRCRNARGPVRPGTLKDARGPVRPGTLKDARGPVRPGTLKNARGPVRPGTLKRCAGTRPSRYAEGMRGDPSVPVR